MDKKDIYEHLARIYLDASSKKSSKQKSFSLQTKRIIIVVTLFVVGLGIAGVLKFNKHNKPFNAQTALVLLNDTAKINFHFDPARKEIYALALNKLNMSSYKALEFSLKKTNYFDTISLRVEFSNAFKEKSEIYLKDVPYKWQVYTINLSEFGKISDWTEMTDLSFIVEEWNAREKKGIVYLDNVRLVK